MEPVHFQFISKWPTATRHIIPSSLVTSELLEGLRGQRMRSPGDAHLSRPGALAHDDLAVGGHLWRVVVDVQHLHGDGDVAEQAGVVCRRDAPVKGGRANIHPERRHSR